VTIKLSAFFRRAPRCHIHLNSHFLCCQQVVSTMQIQSDVIGALVKAAKVICIVSC
jgi:hypothetical protein